MMSRLLAFNSEGSTGEKHTVTTSR